MQNPGCHSNGETESENTELDEAIQQLDKDEAESLARLSNCLTSLSKAATVRADAVRRAANDLQRRFLDGARASAAFQTAEAERGLELATRAAADAAASALDETRQLDALAGSLRAAADAVAKEKEEVALAAEAEAAKRVEEEKEAQRLQAEAEAAEQEAALRRAEELRQRQRLEEEAATAAATSTATAADATANAAETMEAEDDRLWRPAVLEAVGASSTDSAAVAFYDFGGYGCAVRGPERRRADSGSSCQLLPMHRLPLAGIPPTAELVGNAVRLVLPPAPVEGAPVSHVYIMLPHCAQRVASRETVVYLLQDDTWTELPSTETLIEGLEFQTRWVEARLPADSVSATAVAANKLRTDRFRLGRSGLRYSSSVDSRVCLTVPEEAVKVQLDQAMEVQPIDSATLALIKSGLVKETQGLLTCSSIVQHSSPRKNTLKPALFSFPLPLNPPTFAVAVNAAGPAVGGGFGAAGVGVGFGIGFANGKQRPGTAANPRAAQLTPALAYRPLTSKLPALARTRMDHAMNCTDEFLILVGREGKRGATWNLLTDVKLEEESGKDIVSFRTSVLCDRRFIAFRIRSDFNLDMIARICEAIERSLEEKSVCFVIRQKPENLTEVLVTLTLTSKLDRTLRYMQECGYSFEPSMHGVTEEIKVRERQQFRLRFRGNIASEEDGTDGASEFVMLFNSQMRGRLFVTVVEKDRFAQRALDQYRGFLEIFTDLVVLKPDQGVKRTGGGSVGGGGSSVLVTEEVNVARLLVSIPKSADDLRVKSATTTPFSFRAKDAVSAEYLKDLANLVCDNWELLAERLDVSRKRCSVIKKNSDSVQQMAHDMLITWVKSLPVLKNKVLILSRALHSSGYPQLAATLRQLDREQREREIKEI